MIKLVNEFLKHKLYSWEGEDKIRCENIFGKHTGTLWWLLRRWEEEKESIVLVGKAATVEENATDL